MNKVYTVGKIKIGQVFSAFLQDGDFVGSEKLVFVQYSKVPYGIATVIKGDNEGDNHKVTEVFG